MLTPAEKLLLVTPTVPDTTVAMLIAAKLIFYATTEWYRYRINHDISPPKCLACPLAYDWASKGFVGIETTNKAHARQWLTDAALAGYKIEEVDAKRKPTLSRVESIDNVRKRAQFLQSRNSNAHDDDIPF
jgi:hypothetical protein